MKEFYKQYHGYSIRCCGAADLTSLMLFIDKHWAKEHILSVSRKLMAWQYYNRRWNRYNFLMGIDDKNGDILGIISYIPTYIYDMSIGDNDNFVWLSVWKVRDDYAKTALGIQLLSAVFELEDTKNVGTVGNNQAVEPLYRVMKFKTGVLEHYYIANDNMHECSLLNGCATKHNNVSDDKIRIQQIESENELLAFFENAKYMESIYPIKRARYYINRYIKHPFYKYNLFWIVNNGIKTVLLVCRTVQAQGAKAIRIVDINGAISIISGAYGAFQKMLNQSNAEYIDMYCHGLDDNLLVALGFTRKTVESGVTVPNYFEPYTASNVEIRFAYHVADDKQYYIFKGDCDQDRPNQKIWEE